MARLIFGLQPAREAIRAHGSALERVLLDERGGNRLEALKGDLEGLHSIRVNDQWRVVFRWTAAGPEAVDIRDYH